MHFGQVGESLLGLWYLDSVNSCRQRMAAVLNTTEYRKSGRAPSKVPLPQDYSSKKHINIILLLGQVQNYTSKERQKYDL